MTEADIFTDARTAYDWVIDFRNTTGKWPTPKQVGENTSILLPEPPDDLDYVCDLTRKRRLGKSLEHDVKGVIKLLEKRDPDEALKLLGAAASAHRSTRAGAKIRSFRMGGPDRYTDYQRLQSIGGLQGMPTPWRKMNDAILGWVDKQLHVILARQNTGKSWACCIIAEDALSLGVKTLVVSLEMPAERIERRLDALHYKIPFGDIRDVEIDLIREMRWRDTLLLEVAGRGDILVADKMLVRYVSDVTALVLEHEPGLVVIDGGYRFSPKGRNSGDWESSKQIIGELQTTAEVTGIPWIVTTQQGDVGRNTNADAQERALKVRYAREWVINPDIVIEMFQDGDLRLMNQMEWKLLKERESKGETTEAASFMTNWDLHSMNFDELLTASDFADGPTSVVTY